MRAYVLESLESGPTLMDVPTPQVGKHDIRIRVVSSSVNPHDLHVISGSAQAYLEYKFPIILGNDFAGVVDETGPSATRFRRGDKVFGVIQEPVAHRGTFADYVVIPETEFVVEQPDNLSDIHAGVLGLATIAALACLEPLDLRDGETLLVNGATGGVGSAIVQIAYARGARVIATARPGAEENHARELGADTTIDWVEQDVAAAVRALHPAGIDAAIDLINFDPEKLGILAQGVLRPGGRITSTLQATQPNRLPGLTGTNVNASPRMEFLEQMRTMAADGSLKAVVSEVFELSEIESAHAALADGAVGKIAVIVSQTSSQQPKGKEES